MDNADYAVERYPPVYVIE